MTEGCSKRQCAISIAIVFIFTFLYDMFVHGSVLQGLYMQTSPSIWRPEADMQGMFPVCVLFHFLVAVVVTCMFGNYRNQEAASCTGKKPEDDRSCGRKRGICFGIHLGFLFGLLMFANYIWLPVPFTLGAAWFAAGVFKGIGVGYLLSINWTRKD